MSKPRVGFLGVGWIGRSRLQAMIASGAIDAVVVSDPAPAAAAAAAELSGAEAVGDLDALLAHKLDGVVIATPSALHAGQAIAALKAGAAVFCQKPLGRNAAETRAVVAAAKAADRLLGVDLSYRRTAAAEALKALISAGELGDVFAADLTFHNAYGPDKPWFYDRSLSGGGCVIDLGVHLVDLAQWLLGFPPVEQVWATLLAQGRSLNAGAVEDYAVAQLRLTGGAVVRLACSWRLPAGEEALIEARFYGTRGGAALRNVAGSFYDFEAVRLDGTAHTVLVEPPDDWSGRAAADWAKRLSRDKAFDPAAEHLVEVADVLDRIYAAA